MIPGQAHLSLMSDWVFKHVQKRSRIRKAHADTWTTLFSLGDYRFLKFQSIFKYLADLLKTQNTDSIIYNPFLCIDGDESLE